MLIKNLSERLITINRGEKKDSVRLLPASPAINVDNDIEGNKFYQLLIKSKLISSTADKVADKAANKKSS